MKKTTRRTPAAPFADSLAAEAHRRLMAKVPAWADVEGLSIPPRLALEQCSGEAAARYKAEVVRRLLSGTEGENAVAHGPGTTAATGDETPPENGNASAPLPVSGGTMADITGGYGVDFSFLAPLFRRAVYVERQEALCDVARHNFPLLGITNADIVCADAADALARLSPLRLIFADPARRDAAGRKTVGISDCTPDVRSLLPRLLDLSPLLLIKLSPMLDVTRAVADLAPHVAEVHVVAVGGECKELLLVVRRDRTDAPTLHVADGARRLLLPPDAEAAAVAPMATAVGRYLFEPSAALLKAGLFRWTAAHYGLCKLHPNTHLYTADAPVTDFAGRTFRVVGVRGFGKADIRALRASTDRANISVRNFPDSVAALRHRLRVADGGDAYWFATTIAAGRHVLIDCRRA